MSPDKTTRREGTAGRTLHLQFSFVILRSNRRNVYTVCVICLSEFFLPRSLLRLSLAVQNFQSARAAYAFFLKKYHAWNTGGAGLGWFLFSLRVVFFRLYCRCGRQGCGKYSYSRVHGSVHSLNVDTHLF